MAERPEFMENLSQEVWSALRANNNSLVDQNQQKAIENLTKHVRVLWNHIERLEKLLAVGNRSGAAAPTSQAVKIHTASDYTVDANNISLVGDGSVVVQAGSHLNLTTAKSLTIRTGDQAISLTANEVVLKVGAASLAMKKDGSITLKGKDITLDGSGKISVKASGDITMKGAKINQN